MNYQICIDYNQFFNMEAPVILAKHNNDPKHKRAVEFNNNFLNKPEYTSQLSKVGSEIICHVCGGMIFRSNIFTFEKYILKYLVLIFV